MADSVDEAPDEQYPFVKTDDERLRCFIFETMANADIDGNILIMNMEATFQWIKNGAAQAAQPKRSVMRKVSDNG